MSEQDNILTLQETEQLCHLYMECRLSVLEERELQYLLTRLDYHSPVIDEVRSLMEVELPKVTDTPVSENRPGRRRWPQRILYSGIAAAIALFMGIGVVHFSNQESASESYYLAYAGGERLSDEAARIQIEADVQAADEFLQQMEQMEAQEKKMIDNFFNQ